MVRDIPDCDFCGAPAKYDAPTNRGPWAYMCPSCFKKNTRGVFPSNAAEIYGFEFVEKTVSDKQLQVKPPDKIKTVHVPLSMDSVCYVKCPYCGFERAVEPDANYTATCEGCGYEYKIRSMI